MIKEINDCFERFLQYDMKQDYFYKILHVNIINNKVDNELKNTYYEIKLHCDININEEEREYIIHDRFLDYVNMFENDIHDKYTEEYLIDYIWELLSTYSDFEE